MGNLTDEKNTLMLIRLMKEHGVKKIVASPGTTNVALVASLQTEEYFEIYSAYDERSAAYMACGLAAESGEPVALSCTQATASRNYLSGLTEAYYRKLPILAITSTQHLGRIGQNCQQAIDRSSVPADCVNLSVHIPVIYTDDDEWECNVLLNRALLELRRNGGGPVHINLTTTYSRVFPVNELPFYRVINRIYYSNRFPEEYPKINENCKVAIFVGAHKRWSNELTTLVDEFCGKYNGVVLCDQISNYRGKYRIIPNLVVSQQKYDSTVKNIDILIHIGDVNGAPLGYKIKEVWRVNPDGEIRDTFRKERYVFQMEERDFFEKYVELGKNREKNNSFWQKWREECDKIKSKIPELPFSNAWIAQNTIPKLPQNIILHLGIYNSLRFWSMFDTDEGILGYSNTGGFGIDGGMSSMVGAALATDKIIFGIFGDLSFFYDMNSLTNRHLKNNIRILLINNGLGTEFKNPDNRAYSLGEKANAFIAAEGHNGCKSKNLVKHYAEDLGFKYLYAENKKGFLEKISEFVSSEKKDYPILFEVFVNYQDEAKALDIMYNLETSISTSTKLFAKSIIGENGVKTVKKLLKK